MGLDTKSQMAPIPGGQVAKWLQTQGAKWPNGSTTRAELNKSKILQNWALHGIGGSFKPGKSFRQICTINSVPLKICSGKKWAKLDFAPGGMALIRFVPSPSGLIPINWVDKVD